jgi:hypothetical protein
MKKIMWATFVICLIALASCQKDNNNSSSNDGISAVGVDSSTTLGNGPKSSILNATSATQIPSQPFKTSTMYKNSYIHLQQYSGECSWTNYVLCAGTIARFKGYSYPATHAKVTAVRNACNNSSSISALASYSSNHDYSCVSNQLRSSSKTTSGRFQMVKYMLYHLDTYHRPFITLASTPSGVGHYYIIWDINWICGGTGSTIYYTNTLLPPASSFNGNLQSVSLTTFLNWMENNPSASYYNMLALW